MSEISLDAEPDNVAYLDTYGWILFQMGNYEEALKYLLKAIELGGGTGEFYLHLGEIYQAMGKKEDAIDAWRKGLEIEPENKDIKKRLDLIK
jgi:tetratricopeptide (TPR) repeat protein